MTDPLDLMTARLYLVTRREVNPSTALTRFTRARLSMTRASVSMTSARAKAISLLIPFTHAAVPMTSSLVTTGTARIKPISALLSFTRAAVIAEPPPVIDARGRNAVTDLFAHTARPKIGKAG